LAKNQPGSFPSSSRTTLFFAITYRCVVNLSGAAACRADMLAADAFNTRHWRSSPDAFALIHLFGVE
jgi:hypothetical protein